MSRPAPDPWLALAATLSSLSCAFTLPPGARVNTVVKLTAAARRGLDNLRQVRLRVAALCAGLVRVFAFVPVQLMA